MRMLIGMSDSLIIPNDLTACQTLIDDLAQTISEQNAKMTQLKQESVEQQLTINELLQEAFRRRSERYLENPNQMKLDFGNTDETTDAAEGLAEAIEQAQTIVAEHKRRKQSRKPRNEQLPEHLPRYEVELDVPEDVKHCQEHGERKRIGHDRVETLEFERPKLRVRVTLIPKYVCNSAVWPSRLAKQGWSKATAMTPAWRRKSSRPNTAITCLFTANKIGLPAAAGCPTARRG